MPELIVKQFVFATTLIKIYVPFVFLVLGSKHIIRLPAVRIAATAIPSLKLFFSPRA